MTREEPAATPASQRRAERRRATYEEMLSLAREALRDGRPVSLRAIAAEMGMTAPALYRYVDSQSALQEAMIEAIHGEVLARLHAAADTWPTDSHGHRLVCALYAFRAWGLSRPEEFRLVFGEPPGAGAAARPLADHVPHSLRFVHPFMQCLAGMHRMGNFAAAADGEVPDAAVDDLTSILGRCAGQDGVVDAPVGLWWRGLCAWVLLCGVVRMEVDGVPGAALVEDGALFREALALCASTGGVSAAEFAKTVDEVLSA